MLLSTERRLRPRSGVRLRSCEHVKYYGCQMDFEYQASWGWISERQRAGTEGSKVMKPTPMRPNIWKSNAGHILIDTASRRVVFIFP